MKKRRVIVLLCVFSVIGILFVSFIIPVYSYNEKTLGEHIDRTTAYWPDIVENLRQSTNQNIKRGATLNPDIIAFFINSPFTSITYIGDEGSLRCNIPFHWDSYTSVELKYNTSVRPIELIPHAAFLYQPDEWQITIDTDSYARSENLRGYITVEQIRPGWFYIETYQRT